MRRLYNVKEDREAPRLSRKYISVRLVVWGVVRWRGRDDDVWLCAEESWSRVIVVKPTSTKESLPQADDPTIYTESPVVAVWPHK